MSKPIIVFHFAFSIKIYLVVQCPFFSWLGGGGGGRGVNPEKQQFRLVQKHVIPRFSQSS